MTDQYLLYHGKTAPTGRKLRDFLGIDAGTDDPERRVDYLVRWGSRKRITYIPNEQTINRRTRIAQNTNKLKSLRIMDDADVPVPPHSTNHNDLDYPMLGRKTSHSQGTDIALILQQRDIDYYPSDFYTQYIPTDREFRVHIVGGEPIKVNKKLRRNDVDRRDYEPHVRNYESGFVFGTTNGDPEDHPAADPAVKACNALELEIGAVDVIRDEQGNYHVLEVNTAPSLDEANLKLYGDKIAELIELDDYPGMEAVEFENDEDED